MTTRIKLRRDTAQNWTDSNPILANGEPGLESDTNQFKFGDGVTVWNLLGYANASGSGKQNRWLTLLNTCGDGQYTAQSSDGISWTAPTTIEKNQYEWIWGVAIGPNSLVYGGDNPGGSYVTWATTASESPQPIEPIQYIYGPGGESVNYWDVKYEGGYFIAFGEYQYSYEIAHSNNISMPYWIYSEDGKTWNRGGVNQADLSAIISTKNGLDEWIYGMYLSDVSYNGTGWLFSTEWDYDGPSPSDAGGFYLTSIAGTLNTTTRGTSIPTADHAYWDGVKWWTFIWDNEDNIYYTNTSLNPTQGSWTPHYIDSIASPAFGSRGEYYYSIEGFASGTIDGVEYLVMGIDDGCALVTADKGSTWHGVVPSISRDVIYGIDGGPYCYLDFSDSNPRWVGEKITIAGSSVSAMNGSFYVGYQEGDYWPLYSDIGLQNPILISGWTIDAISVTASWSYGSNKIYVNDATDLNVGMTSGGGAFGISQITAINGSVLTMDHAAWNTEIDIPMVFTACVSYSHGDYIYNTKYGNEEFVLVTNLQGPGNSTAVAHSDPRVQGNWTSYWATWSQEVPYLWINDIEYGSLNAVASSLTYQNPTLTGAINELVLTDRLTISLTGSGQYDPPVSTTLFMDPAIASWNLSAQSGWGEYYDLGSISSYNNNDVRMTINNKSLVLNWDGSISTTNYTFPEAGGTANQVLKTDGSGNLSWTSIGGGSVSSESPNVRTGTADTLTIGSSANVQSAITGHMASYDYHDAPRLVIAGRDSYYDGNTSAYLGEGGDLYMWAGRGFNGGDIKIDAGNSDGASQEGGTIKIRAGNNSGGYGGFVHIEAGYGSNGTNGGNVVISTLSGAHNWTFRPDGTMGAADAVLSKSFILSTDGVSTTGAVRLADNNSKLEFYAPSGFNFNASSVDIFGGTWNYSWNAATRRALTVNDMIAPTNAGGNIAIASNPPAHYYGAAGDKQGMVAFDGIYIYYCTDTFTPATLTSSIDGTMAIVSGEPFNLTVNNSGVDLTGWNLSIPDYTPSTVSAWINNGAGSITVTVNGSYSGSGNFTLTFTQPDASVTTPIWKRLAWSSDTW